MMVKKNWQICSALVALALFFGLGTVALAGDAFAPAGTTEAAIAATTTVLHIDFDNYALGPLGAPWSISKSGNSQASIENTLYHGHVLRLQGDTAEGSFLIASRSLSSSSTDITSAVDIKPNSGAAFVWSLNGAGSSIGRRRIRLQQSPGSTMLVASTVPSGNTNCGTLAAGAWSRVTLIVHTLSRKFDVRINGASTSCTGIAADIQPPFNGVSVMDASNAGWGGTVRFDNIDVTTP